MDKREKKETAPLSKLYTILKGNLFQHQVFFYYILFQVWQVNVSEKNIENYVEKLREQIKKLYADEIKEKDLKESEEAKKFYVFLINMPETEKLEKSCYPEFKGSFVEQEKTNINKTINGKRNIKHYFCKAMMNVGCLKR